MRLSALVVAPLFLIACSNSDSSTTGGGGSGGGGGTGGDTTLQPPEHGVQFATTDTVVEAGTESYKCWTFDLPADAPLDLTGIETQVDSGAVHHYGVFTNTSPLAAEEECEQMGATWGLVSGGGLGTPAVHFPEGTAMPLAAGSHIIVQLHLLNASSDPVTVPPVLVNLGAAPKGTSFQQVGLLIGGTLKIDLPAHSKDLTVSGGCKLPNDMEHIFAVFPHMHRLGRTIQSMVTPADGTPERMLSEVTWDFSDQGLYPIEGTAKTGDDITIACTYDNPGDTDVTFGLSSSNEMCVNVLYYYPATKGSQYCGIP